MKDLAEHIGTILTLSSIFGCLLLGLVTWIGKRALPKLDTHSEMLIAVKMSLDEGNRRFSENDKRYQEMRDKTHNLSSKITSNDLKLRIIERNEALNV